MIVSSLQAWPAQQAAFHPAIRQALAFIASQDFQRFAPGKIDLIPGNFSACCRRWRACLSRRRGRSRTSSLLIFSI